MITAEHILIEKDRSMITIESRATVMEAVRIMKKNNVGSIVVKDGDDIVGIYTERELLFNVTDPEFDLHKACLRDYMVEDLNYASSDATVHELQDNLLGKCLRYVLITKGEETIGLISAGDVTRADLVEHEKTLHSVSWAYYEDWKWRKKK